MVVSEEKTCNNLYLLIITILKYSFMVYNVRVVNFIERFNF